MRRCMFIVVIMIGAVLFANTGSISGRVISGSESLVGANVFLEGTSQGATTDSLGSYSITDIPFGKYTIRADYIGYESSSTEIYISPSDVDSDDEQASSFSSKFGLDEEEQTSDIVKGNQLTDLDFNLTPRAVGLNEVIVSAAKKKQKITKAPATISTMNNQSIRRQVGVNAFTRLVTSLKGVDVSYYGVDGAQINARGFSGMFSTRFKQYNDGLDMSELFSNQLFTSIASPPKESIEKIEIIFGPQSSLYGADASTGLLNILHKDPRTNQDNEINFFGTTVDKYRLGSRIASKVSKNLAWDIVTELSQAKEFDYGNTEKDENGNYIDPVSWIEENSVTGEVDTMHLDEDFYGVLDQNKFYLRSNLLYTFKNGHLLKVSPIYLKAKGYTMGSMGVYYTKNYENKMLDIQYSTDKHHLRYHVTGQGTESIFREPLAHFSALNGLSFEESVERAGIGELATDSLTWFQNYTGIGHLMDYQFNTEMDLGNLPLDMVAGLDYELLDPTSNRTMFDDNGWDYYNNTMVADRPDIREWRYGIYAQFETDLTQTISITGSARYDIHEYFGDFISPKLSIVKDHFYNGSLKFMLGRGLKAPSLTERWVYSGTKNYIVTPQYTLHAIAMGNLEGFTLNNYIDNNFNRIYDEGDSLIYTDEINPIDLEITNTAELSYVGLLRRNIMFEVGAYVSEYENFKTAAMHIATTGPWWYSSKPTDPFPNLGPMNPLPFPGYEHTFNDPWTMIEVVKGNGEVVDQDIIVITYGSLPVKTNVWGLETGLKYFSDKFDVNLNYTYFDDSDLVEKRDKAKRYRNYLTYLYGDSTTQIEYANYANDDNLESFHDFFDVYSNTPNHQMNLSITGYDLFLQNLSVGVQLRAISEFEFKSGWFQATNDGNMTDPPIYRTTQTYYKDKGPIGGGFYADLNLSYELKENYSIGFSVKNIFESEAISFPLSPKQPRYFVLETGYSF